MANNEKFKPKHQDEGTTAQEREALLSPNSESERRGSVLDNILTEIRDIQELFGKPVGFIKKSSTEGEIVLREIKSPRIIYRRDGFTTPADAACGPVIETPDRNRMTPIRVRNED